MSIADLPAPVPAYERLDGSCDWTAGRSEGAARYALTGTGAPLDGVKGEVRSASDPLLWLDAEARSERLRT